jgi:hypothetical protein
MNALINSDIANAMILLRAAINNAMDAIEKGEVDEITLGYHVPFSMVIEVAKSRGWKEDEHTDFETNGWQNDCWYCMIIPNKKVVMIESCLWCGQPTKLIVK